LQKGVCAKGSISTGKIVATTAAIKVNILEGAIVLWRCGVGEKKPMQMSKCRPSSKIEWLWLIEVWRQQ
jgi:hypothetical protein